MTDGPKELGRKGPGLFGVARDEPDISKYFTSRELDILRRLATGNTTPQVASDLGISTFALTQHVRRFQMKLGVTTVAAAVARAIQAGLIESPMIRAWPEVAVSAVTAGAPKADGPKTRLAELLVAADKEALIDRGGDDYGKAQRRDEARRVALLMIEYPFESPLKLANDGFSREELELRGRPFYNARGLTALFREFPTILSDTNLITNVSEAIDHQAVQVLRRAMGLQQKGDGLDDATCTGIAFIRTVVDKLPPTRSSRNVPRLFSVTMREHAPHVAAQVLDALGVGESETLGQEAVARSRIVELMERFPLETGAQGLDQRHEIARSIVVSALSEATPERNLYEVLEEAANRIEQRLGPRARIVTPEDLMIMVAGEGSVLRELVDARSGDHDRALALALVREVGRKRLAGMSVAEISRHMDQYGATLHPYDAGTIRRLMVAHPQIFGLKPPDSRGSEFLLANQVADAMNRIDWSATLDEVAEFLKSERPGFALSYPGFSAADIRMLQRAFTFMPQWEVKPEVPEAPARNRLSIERLTTLAGMALGPDQSKELHTLVIDALGEGLRLGKAPPGLQPKVHSLFDKELLRTLIEHDLGERMTSRQLLRVSGGPAGQYRQTNAAIDTVERALGDGTDAPEAISARLTALGMSPARSNLMVRVAAKVRALEMDDVFDYVGIRPDGFLLDSRKEALRTKLSLLALSRETVLDRIESDIFQNNELRASFQRFSRIPLRLPMIQKVVEKYQEDQPFKDTNVLMVQHMLGQTYPQISGYVQLGMDPKNAILVGVPYHKNVEVEEAVARSFGMDVRVPPRSVALLKQEIYQAVDEMVAKHRDNGKPCLVVCDGPEARTYFMEKYAKRDPSLVEHFRFTEQTAFGDRPEYRNMKLRCVSYARKELKAKEALFVGQSIVRAFQQHLIKMGTGYEEKSVLVRGLGPVGWATAAAFHGDRAKVAVYDPKWDPTSDVYDPNEGPKLHAQAESLGYRPIIRREDARKGFFLDVGCSGYCSIDEEEFLEADPFSVKGSGSSKQAEMAMEKLHRAVTDENGNLRRAKASQVNDQEAWSYWLPNGKIITVIGEGFPVNFNDINVVPPEFIDSTMSLGLAAAVQAMRGNDMRFEDLNEGDHGMLDDHFENFLSSLG